MKQVAVGDVVKLSAAGPCSQRGTVVFVGPDPGEKALADYLQAYDPAEPALPLEDVAKVRWPDGERSESLSALERTRPVASWLCGAWNWLKELPASVLAKFIGDQAHLG